MSFNAPDSTLTAIMKKVRRLTRTPSTAQLSDNDLVEYINTFVVYDFPEHLRMFNLKTVFNFWCNPYQDVYPTDTESFVGVTTNQLYDFQNRYLSIAPPVYMAGYQSFYTQSREQFYGIYPQTNNIQSIGTTGDGSTVAFTGNVPILSQSNVPNSAQGGACLVKGEVLFSSVDTLNEGLALVDVPVVDSVTGNPTTVGNLYTPETRPSTPPTSTNLGNFINYVTGEFSITFPSAPAQVVLINSQTLPQIVSLPQAMLFYDNQFVLRPVPDQPYQIQFEAYVRPTYLMETNSQPQLQEWWQYISYGAAKKIFEDRMDMESVQMIMPEYRKQETLCLRRTLVQMSNQRTATIYTEQVGLSAGLGGYWGSGGSSF